MKMKEMISILYMFKDRPDLLTDVAARNIVTKGLMGYIGPDADKMRFPCFGSHYPETENHVLMIETSRYLTNQWLYNNPRYDSELSSYSGNDNYKNDGTQVESVLLQAMARIVWGDAFEANGRTYQGLTASAILNLYNYAKSEKIRAAAKNALDMMTVKFAFQSFEGKRFGPTRRNHSYANSLNMQEHDSFSMLAAGLSGGYVWNDDPDSPECFYNITWENNYGGGNLLHQGIGLALWSSLSSYNIPEAAHDFLLNKHNGYWARFHPIHYTDEYRSGSWADYFSSATTREIHGSRMFAPEAYFAHPKFMNVSGGRYEKGPLPNYWTKENRTYVYANLSRPMVVLTRGNYGAWGDNVKTLHDEPEYFGLATIDRNISNFETKLLNMQGEAVFWKSEYNYGTYKNFSYGFYHNEENGANKTSHTYNPWKIPNNWVEHTRFTRDRGNFYIYDSKEGFYVVLGQVSKSRDMEKYRNYSRGFWEIVPSERFGNSIENLTNWVKENNPASKFQNTTSGENKWYKYKMTSGETVWLDIIVGYNDGSNNDPIIRVYDHNGNQISLSDAITSRTNYANDPLMDVRAVDSEFRTLNTKYAWSTGKGRIDVNNPFLGSGLIIQSQDYTAPFRIEKSASLEDAMEWNNIEKIEAKAASGFLRVANSSMIGGDHAVSEPLDDFQNASFEFRTYIGSGITFDWGVSSEYYYDYLTVYVDGIEKTKISGETIETDKFIAIPSGYHTVKFEYSKDLSVSRGSDNSWVDNVRLQ